MLHPSISRGSTVINGIYANQFGPTNTQVAMTPFQAYQKDKLNLAYTESFALRAYVTGATAQSFKAFLNDDPISELSVLDKLDTHIGVAAGLVIYDGAGATNITLGTGAGKPLLDSGLFTVTDFLNTVGKSANYVLSINNASLLYLFTLTNDNKVGLYNMVAGSWTLIQAFANGHAFIATDKVGFKITPAKIELLINGVSVWEKVRSWTVTLSNADLGTLATTPESPYDFGEYVELTTGNVSGPFTLSFQNQEGVSYKIDQSIEVLTTTAPTPAAPTSTEDLMIPILAAASLANQQNVVVAQPAESTDWGKIGIWGGLALVGLLLLAGVAWAVRSK